MSISRASPATIVALLCAFVFSAAHAGVPEWDAHVKSGLAAYERGNYRGAAASLAAAVKEAEALGEADRRLPLTLNILGSQYLSRGDYAAAEPLLKRALAIREKTLGPMHPDVARSRNNLATLYIAQRKLDKAEPLFKSSAEISEKVLGPHHPDLAQTLYNLALLHIAQGRYTHGESQLRRAAGIWEKVGDVRNHAMAVNSLGHLYSRMGRTDDAEKVRREIASSRVHARDRVLSAGEVSQTVKVLIPQ